MMLSFAKTGINVVKAKINGTEIPPFMWEPYFADVSELVREGRNKLELTLINNLRNMQGPLHLTEGESYYVCPPSFIKEKCIWYDGNEKNKTACREFESYYPCHVGTSETCSDFLFHKKSVTRSTVPPLSQKVTFASAIRLQAPS